MVVIPANVNNAHLQLVLILIVLVDLLTILTLDALLAIVILTVPNFVNMVTQEHLFLIPYVIVLVMQMLLLV